MGAKCLESLVKIARRSSCNLVREIRDQRTVLNWWLQQSNKFLQTQASLFADRLQNVMQGSNFDLTVHGHNHMRLRWAWVCHGAFLID